MARDGRQQHTRLPGRQGLDRSWTMPGRVGQRRDVARDQLPSKGQIQRRAQHVARPASHVGGARRLHAAQTRYDILRRESGEPDAPQAGQQVGAHDLFVALLSSFPDLALLDVQPAMQEGADRLLLRDRGQPVFLPVQRLA